jgi:hypothetical protein
MNANSENLAGNLIDGIHSVPLIGTLPITINGILISTLGLHPTNKRNGQKYLRIIFSCRTGRFNIVPANDFIMTHVGCIYPSYPSSWTPKTRAWAPYVLFAFCAVKALPFTICCHVRIKYVIVQYTVSFIFDQLILGADLDTLVHRIRYLFHLRSQRD